LLPSFVRASRVKRPALPPNCTRSEDAALKAAALHLNLEETAMTKPGIAIDIPGFGKRVIHTIVSDYTRTLMSLQWCLP